MRYAPTVFGGRLFFLGIFSHSILTALPGEPLVTSFSPPWRAYAIRPYSFWRKTFLFADYMIFLSSTASVEAKSLINVFICIFAYSKLPVRFGIVKISF